MVYGDSKPKYYNNSRSASKSNLLDMIIEYQKVDIYNDRNIKMINQLNKQIR